LLLLLLLVVAAVGGVCCCYPPFYSRIINMKCSSIAVLALAIPSSTLVVSAFVMVIPNTIMYVNEEMSVMSSSSERARRVKQASKQTNKKEIIKKDVYCLE
jgi:hypothetical protein